jgi:hypothetical protein
LADQRWLTRPYIKAIQRTGECAMSETISLDFIGQSLKRLNDGQQKLIQDVSLLRREFGRMATRDHISDLHQEWFSYQMDREAGVTACLRLEAGIARIEAALLGKGAS